MAYKLIRIIDESSDFYSSYREVIVEVFDTKKAAQLYLQNMVPRDRSYHDYEIRSTNKKDNK